MKLVDDLEREFYLILATIEHRLDDLEGRLGENERMCRITIRDDDEYRTFWTADVIRSLLSYLELDISKNSRVIVTPTKTKTTTKGAFRND